MFEGLRKHSQSFFLVILIASLATVFGVSFGPGSRGCSSGSLRVNYIARVHGTNVSEADFQSAARLARLTSASETATPRATIINRLIERELLAYEAERLGFQVSDSDINREIQDGFFYSPLGPTRYRRIMGDNDDPPLTGRDWTIYSSSEGRAQDAPPPAFRYDDFEAWVRGVFGRTVREYKALMGREMLAERMRQMIMANVQVSEDEVWRDYERQRNQTSIRYMKFSPEFYRLTVRDDDQAALDAYAQAHAADITAQYERERETLQHRPVELRIRQLLVRFPENADDAARTATQQRADAVRERITQSNDFVRIARLYSGDESNWRTAGESDWVTVERADVNEDVRRQLGGMHRGDLSQAIRSPLGLHIVQVVDRREGDIAEADARRDITRRLYRNARAIELATEAAAHAQQLLGEANATFESVAARIHTEALRAFYHGAVPEAETLTGNTTLAVVTHADGDIGGPELQQTEGFHQGGDVPNIRDSEALARAAFQLTDEHPSAAQPVQLGEDRYVIRLRDHGRQLVSRDEFNRNRLQEMQHVIAVRRLEALRQYISRLRSQAEHQGEVRIGNSPLIRERPSGSDQPSSG